MIFEEKLAVVVRLASLTEDRTRLEQKALLDVAHHVDKKLNAQTRTNSRAEYYYSFPSRLAVDSGCGVADCRVCNKIPDRSVPA